MINAFNNVMKYVVKVGPHSKKIDENRERVYQLSRHLPEEEGYELINLFDNTIKETKKLCEKENQIKNQKEDK